MDVKPSFFPAGFAGLMSNMAAERAAQRAASTPVRMHRTSLLTAAQVALSAGRLPDLLVFTSEVNYGYNRHAKALHDLAAAGDLAGLQAYPVNGVNTYGRALRGYRDLLVFHVEREAKAASVTVETANANVASAKSKAVTKKAPAKKKQQKASVKAMPRASVAKKSKGK